MALQTENILKLIFHFAADTDAEENSLGIQIFVADAETAVLCSLEGGSIADKNYFGNNF